MFSLDWKCETTLRLSVDPQSGFIIRRYEMRSGPTIIFQANIDYSADKKIPWLWIPSRWDILVHPMPNRKITIHGVLTKCTVNPAIDEHAFDEPEYAKGTSEGQCPPTTTKNAREGSRHSRGHDVLVSDALRASGTMILRWPTAVVTPLPEARRTPVALPDGSV